MKTVAEIRKYIQLNRHELNNDQLEKLYVEMNRIEDLECGVIPSSILSPNTKKGLVFDIQRLVKENNVKDSYLLRYFNQEMTVSQMSSGIAKDQLQIIWNELNQN